MWSIQIPGWDWKKLLDLAGSRATDHEPALWSDRCDVEPVIGVDEQTARLSEGRPLIDEPAILVEDLNAIVVAIGDKEPAS